MNYKKIYIKIIRRAQTRSKPECYCDKHHIFPKSIFGENKSIVFLTLKEHICAHHLLWRYFLKQNGSCNIKTRKMLYAYWQLINGARGNKNINKCVNARIFFIETMREKMIGDKNPAKNIVVRKKISLSKIGVKNPMFGKYAQNNPNFGQKRKSSKYREGAKNRMLAIVRISMINPADIKYYECIMDAAREGFDKSHIARCCKNKMKFHKGYFWKYKEMNNV